MAGLNLSPIRSPITKTDNDNIKSATKPPEWISSIPRIRSQEEIIAHIESTIDTAHLM